MQNSAVSFHLPAHFDDGGRIGLETKIMMEYINLVHESITDKEKLNKILSVYQQFQNEDTNNLLQNSFPELVKDVLHQFNVSRLENLAKLQKLEQSYRLKLLPPQWPSEYIEEQTWATDASKWIGHGYYWKSGDGEMNKDLAFMDYDTLEDNFYHIKNSKVLLADYGLLKKDFPTLNTLSNQEIDDWLISNCSYLSEGQYHRMSVGGDIHDFIEFENKPLDHFLDTNRKKIGLRMRGGGRAATFLVDKQEYSWDKDGTFQSEMLEVKGLGTTILQKEIEVKACGLLSFVDAIKEFAYQKLIQKISEIENQNWATVGYYAILDTPFRCKSDVANPGTGYKGDRFVLVVRQRQSRIVSCFDEIVYYSVARREHLVGSFGKEFRLCLQKYGISSEQLPALLSSGAVDDISGDWNVQGDAILSHIIDFSHFFILPSSSLDSRWKVSENATKDALLLGGDRFSIFQNQKLRELLFPGADEQQAREEYEKQKLGVAEKYKQFGTLGARKPSYSWSWFLETDDSWIASWCMQLGSSSANQEPTEIFNSIEDLLPKK